MPHESCVHIKKYLNLYEFFNFLKVFTTSTCKTQTLVCESCYSKQPDSWICATCFQILCGRANAEHTREHYLKVNHPLFFRVYDGALWCYECNSFLDVKSSPYDQAKTLWAVCRHLAARTPLPDSFFVESTPPPSSDSAIGFEVEYTDSDDLEEIQAFQLGPGPVSSSARPSARGRDLGGSQFACVKETLRCGQGTPSSMNPSSSEFPESRLSMTGLTNLGNTCYMNSVLQILARIPSFGNYTASLLAHAHAIPPADTGTMPSVMQEMYSQFRYSFLDLIVRLQRPGNKTIVPSAFMKAFKFIVPQFRGMMQQDAHEAFLLLLERLSFSFASLGRWGEAAGLGDVDWRNPRAAAQAPVSRRTPTRLLPSIGQRKTFVEDLFEGKVAASHRCPACGLQVYKKERFLNISLPIDNAREKKTIKKRHKTLGGLIEAFLTTTNNTFRTELNSCDACSSACDVGSRHFWLLPKILVFHLRRLSVKVDEPAKASAEAHSLTKTYKKFRIRKNLDYIKCPLDGLDLSSFLHKKSPHISHQQLNASIELILRQGWSREIVAQSFVAGISTSDARSNMSSGLPLYDLVGVVNHRGHRASGHYSAIIRLSPLPGHAPADRPRWYQFNDKQVVPLNKYFQKEKRLEERIITPAAYMLFYVQRESTSQKLVKSQIKKLIEKPAFVSPFKFKAQAFAQMPPLKKQPGSGSLRQGVAQGLRKFLYKEKYSSHKYLISIEWINRLLSFPWPGPVNNALLFNGNGLLARDPGGHRSRDASGADDARAPEDVRPYAAKTQPGASQNTPLYAVTVDAWRQLVQTYGLALPVHLSRTQLGPTVSCAGRKPPEEYSSSFASEATLETSIVLSELLFSKLGL
eukprot:gnl/Chilomastix_cuspidata/6611.p1 GENE.gnl/Chilomastix_cuspidata/6611~~gnl/Chilomastix_cuspidata/6611.p1  ORF type:complete len:884 (+),score=72.44 gnl/Chilomastix_cuspidata/6611:71-2653(+)